MQQNWKLSLMGPMCILAALYGCAIPNAVQDDVLDLILAGGMILDGTGRAGEIGDVGLRDGYIVALGSLDQTPTLRRIDVSGLHVAPGFVNLHSHATFSGLQRAENMLLQGVTTEILGPDGGGSPRLLSELVALSADPGIAVNVGSYIGFNAVWAETVGLDEVPATPEQIQAMRAIMIDAMESGVWGVSSGLDYVPGYYASREQVIEVVSAVRRWRTNFPNHERLNSPDEAGAAEESTYSSRFGILETIEIGQQAGVSPVITHIKLQGSERGRAAEVVALLDEASRSGLYASADVYPYVAGMTGLHSLIIPPWAQAGGRDAMLERFADPQTRIAIIALAEHTMKARWGGANNVYIVNLGQTLASVMEERDLSAGEALLQVLEREPSRAILAFGDEADLHAFLKYPHAAISDDGGATDSTLVHPRSYGTFARVLGRYVRELGVLGWEEAIRKMSGLPASIVGMTDRGLLALGMVADVVVYDPEAIIDRATFEDPAQLAEGVVHVFVRGQQAVADGVVTGARAGRVLYRSSSEPSRPMNMDADRQISLLGEVALSQSGEMLPLDARVQIDVRQSPNAVRANGVFRVSSGNGAIYAEITQFGVLQTHIDWAGFSGMARITMPGQPETLSQPVRVIVDRANPTEEAGTTLVIIELSAEQRIVGRMRGENAEQ